MWSTVRLHTSSRHSVISHPVHVPFLQVTHIEELPARQAQHAAPTASLAPAVAAALQLRGVACMFTHQAAAIDELLRVRGIGVLPGLHKVRIHRKACAGKHPAVRVTPLDAKDDGCPFTHGHTVVSPSGRVGTLWWRPAPPAARASATACPFCRRWHRSVGSGGGSMLMLQVWLGKVLPGELLDCWVDFSLPLPLPRCAHPTGSQCLRAAHVPNQGAGTGGAVRRAAQIAACIACMWHGMAWHGLAWLGMACRHVAWHGVAWRGMAWHGVSACHPMIFHE